MSCCYKCPKRTMTCHGTCEDYAKEMEENEKRRNERIKEIQNEEALHSPAFHRRARNFLNDKK